MIFDQIWPLTPKKIWKIFIIAPLKSAKCTSPWKLDKCTGKKSKILNFAGNGLKHVVLTWNEFWSWKKLKNRDLKIFEIFPPKPQALRRFFGEKSKILNFAGNGPKHVVLAWNEFCSWKKLKNRVLKVFKLISQASDVTLAFFVLLKNRKFFESSDHQDME